MNADINKIFESLPGCYLILLPDPPMFTIYEVNKAFLHLTKTNRDIIGRPIFEVFPGNPDNTQSNGIRSLYDSLMTVMNTRRKQFMPLQRFDIQSGHDASFEIHYWKPANIPVLDSEQRVLYIIHTIKDVTKQFTLRQYLKRRNEEFQNQISNAVSTTQEMERMEISRELHDNVVQILNASRLYLGRALKKDPVDIQAAESSLQLVDKAIAELRNLSHALLESSQKEESLTRQIEGMLQHVFTLNHINIYKKIDLPDEALIESKMKLAIIRIVQEQLANVVKHSMAKNLWIDVDFKNNQLDILIKDDGVGFEMEDKSNGLGLQNIKTRVAMMNGEVLIYSSPGDGCQIRVSFPMA